MSFRPTRNRSSPKKRSKSSACTGFKDRTGLHPYHARFDDILTGWSVIFAYSRQSVSHSSVDVPAHQSRKIHVRGFVEEGTTTTPFDMTVMRLAEHRAFVREDGEDMPEIQNSHCERTS
ncbi:hypothetical protein [Rhizobium leguminosarum]|uniref:phosphoketolase family protein n=1 Tax=Rhizobium leguminosarum TaxID=384 RepID=UPI003F9C2FE9